MIMGTSAAMETPAAMETCPWNDFRLAAIAGDISRIKTHHANKDFRIFLQSDQSALDLASRNGHIELVDYFLDSLGEFTKEEKEMSRVLSTALRDACKGGQVDMVKYLIHKLTYDRSKLRQLGREYCTIPGRSPPRWRYSQFILMCAIACKKMEILISIMTYYKDYKHYFDDDEKFIRVAFETGSPEILSVVIEYLEVKVAGTYIPVFECFIHCALGNVEEVREEIMNNDQWFCLRESHKVGNFDEVYNVSSFGEADEEIFPDGMRLVGVAARFGHFELVKELVSKIEDLQCCNILELTLREVLLQAWSTDRLEIVQWLHESKKMELKPPHTYRGVGMFGANSVFHYIKFACPNVDSLTNPSQFTVYDLSIFDLQNEKSIDVIEHYMDMVCLGMNFGRWGKVLRDCLLSEWPGLALKVFPLCKSETAEVNWPRMFNAIICTAITFGEYEKALPCIPIVEFLLEKMHLSLYKDGPNGFDEMASTNLLKEFMTHGGIVDVLDDTKFNDLPFDLFYANIKVVFSILLGYGASVTRSLVRHVFLECIYSSDFHNSQFLARAMVLMDFVDVTSLLDGETLFDDDACHYFATQEQNPMVDAKKDVLYRNLLLGLLGCEKTTIKFRGLLRFICEAPDQLRVKYVKLISDLGLVIIDPDMTTRRHREVNPGPVWMGSSNVMDQVTKLAFPRVPSLLNVVRHYLFKLIRKNHEMKRKRGEIILTFPEMVATFAFSPEINFLPVPLPDLFKRPVVPTMKACGSISPT